MFVGALDEQCHRVRVLAFLHVRELLLSLSHRPTKHFNISKCRGSIINIFLIIITFLLTSVFIKLFYLFFVIDTMFYIMIHVYTNVHFGSIHVIAVS